MSFVLVKNSAKTITTLNNLFFGGSEEKPHKFRSRRLKNAKKITYEQWKSFAFQTVNFVCNFLCLFLVICSTEVQALLADQQQRWIISDCLLVIALSSAIFYIAAYVNEIKVEILSGQSDDTRAVTLGQVVYGVLMAVFFMVHPSNYFIGVKLSEYDGGMFRDLNTFFTVVCYFRIAYIYGYLSKNSRYYGTRISRLLAVYGTRSKANNIIYAIKCLFKESSFISSVFLYSFTGIFFALVGILISAEEDLSTYIYICLETMTTVGYGQFTATGSLQRFVLILVTIVGSFAGSAFTIYFLEFLELQDNEANAYRLIKRLTYQEKIREYKIEIIENFVRKKSISPYKWKSYQKQLQSDKSPMLEFLTINLKVLLESQLLSSNLLSFYFNRRQIFEIGRQYDKQTQRKEKKSKHWKQVGSIKSQRRKQDSQNLFAIKERILGYKQSKH